MSSLPTDIWQVIVGFCPRKLMFREVCKQLSNEVVYVVSCLCLPNKPIIEFPKNLRVMELKLNANTSNEDLQQTGIEFEHIVSLDCGNNVFLRNKALSLFPSLTALNCSRNIKFTDKGLAHLKNLFSLKCMYNINFTDKGLVHLKKLKCLACGFNTNFTDKCLAHLQKLESLSCQWNTNFTNAGLMYLPKLVKLDMWMTEKITNEGISHLKFLEEITISKFHSRLDTSYDKDNFPFVEVDENTYANKIVFQKVLWD